MNWISVKEKLPSFDENDKHFACLVSKHPYEPIFGYCIEEQIPQAITKMVGIVFYDLLNKDWIKRDSYGEITHWCPLPTIHKVE